MKLQKRNKGHYAIRHNGKVKKFQFQHEAENYHKRMACTSYSGFHSKAFDRLTV